MTRTYTHPEVFAAAAAGADWADPETDPTRIDWVARQAACPLAFAPGFRLVDGRPVSPGAPTGFRYGRNRLGHWGPQLCADAMVTATGAHDNRWILLIERCGNDGTSGWALPGGYVEAGEDPVNTAARELAEETGLVLPAAVWQTSPARYVPDTRESDEAWMVTTVNRIHLPGAYVFDRFPQVTGGDDAKRAAWLLAESYAYLDAYLSVTYGGAIFPAHQQILRDALDTPGGPR